MYEYQFGEFEGLMNTFTAGERPLSEGYEKIAVPVPLQVRFPWVKGGRGRRELGRAIQVPEGLSDVWVALLHNQTVPVFKLLVGVCHPVLQS